MGAAYCDESYLSRVLQLLKCATCQNPTGSLLSRSRQNGLQPPRTPGGVEQRAGTSQSRAPARADPTGGSGRDADLRDPRRPGEGERSSNCEKKARSQVGADNIGEAAHRRGGREHDLLC